MTAEDRLSLAEHFLTRRLEEGRGDRVALRLDGGTRTYAEVEAAAGRMAAALAHLDVRPEERVLILLPDGEDFVAAFFGIAKRAAVVVMVNPAQPPEALAGILGYARARAAVTTAAVAPAVRAAASLAGVACPLLLSVDAGVGAGADPGDLDLVDLALDDVDPPGEVPAVPCHPDDPAVWLFSGGTTGTPKAVVQTLGSFVNTTARYGLGVLGLREDDVTIAVPRLYFGYATGSALLFPFAAGAATVLFAEHPTPRGLRERIARHGATVLVTVPSMVTAMLAEANPEDLRRDLATLRLATSAGEALPPDLYTRWREGTGVELLDGLGTAEQWHVFLSNRPDRVRPGTLGWPVEGFDVEARDDAGARVPNGEVGHLWVRGDSRALGYWRNLAATRQAFRGDWVVTGDLVREELDGAFTYVGRGDDALKVKGKWLVPAEVEGVLLDHPSVGDCAVVGAADADGLLKPVAFVVASQPVEPGALDAHVRTRLDAYKCPRVITIVEELPRTHLGKTDRGALRRRAELALRARSAEV